MYGMVFIKPDLTHVVSVVSKYTTDPGQAY